MFISYAPEDAQYVHELESHLAALRRLGAIEIWHTGYIHAGCVISDEYKRQFDSADLILVLISADFLRSDTLNEQLQNALTRRTTGILKILPVLVRSVDLTDSPLGRLPLLPEGEIPITLWGDRDAAWTNVTRSIRRAALVEFPR